MSRPVNRFDQLEPCPDLGDRFREWADAPWFDRVDEFDVDEERTAALLDWNHTVKGRAGGGPPWHGVPFQIVESGQWRRVWDASRPGSWLPWAWDPFPSERLLLPDLVRRYGDPTPEMWGDFQSFLIEGTSYWELSSFGPTPFGWPHPWRAGHIARFRLDRPWDHRSQPRSVTAAGIAMVPMLLTKEKLTGAAAPTALHLVSPHYSGERIEGFASKTDGLTRGHPLFAGTRLRLRADFTGGETHDDRELVHIAKTCGFVVTDKNSHQGANARPVPFDQSTPGYRVRVAQDPRIDLTVTFTAGDLEVLSG